MPTSGLSKYERERLDNIRRTQVDHGLMCEVDHRLNAGAQQDELAARRTRRLLLVWLAPSLPLQLRRLGLSQAGLCISRWCCQPSNGVRLQALQHLDRGRVKISRLHVAQNER